MSIRSLFIASAGAASVAACTAASGDTQDAVQRGKFIYDKECAQCHGAQGEGTGAASLGLGTPAPDLVGLKQRNDGYFPREFVRRFVLGLLETDDPDAAMPEFAKVGLRHVYPDGGADGEVLESDLSDLLDYLASIQE